MATANKENSNSAGPLLSPPNKLNEEGLTLSQAAAFEYVKHSFLSDPQSAILRWKQEALSSIPIATEEEEEDTGWHQELAKAAFNSEPPLASALADNILNEEEDLLLQLARQKSQDPALTLNILLAACWGGSEKLVQKLLAEGTVSIFAKDEAGRSPLFYTVIGESTRLALKILRAAHRALNSSPPLSQREVMDNIEQMINGKDQRGWNVFLLAVCKGQAEVVETLLSLFGNAVDTKATIRHTSKPHKGSKELISPASCFAAMKVTAGIRILQALIHADREAALMMPDSAGRKCTHYAVAYGNHDVATFLVTEAQMDPLETDDELRSPLFVSVAYNQPLTFLKLWGVARNREPELSLTEVLIDRKDVWGLSALHLTHIRNNKQMVLWLSRAWNKLRNPQKDPTHLVDALFIHQDPTMQPCAHNGDGGGGGNTPQQQPFPPSPTSVLSTNWFRIPFYAGLKEQFSKTENELYVMLNMALQGKRTGDSIDDTDKNGDGLGPLLVRAIIKAGIIPCLAAYTACLTAIQEQQLGGPAPTSLTSLYFKKLKEEIFRNRADENQAKEIWRFINVDLHERPKVLRKHVLPSLATIRNQGTSHPSFMQSTISQRQHATALLSTPSASFASSISPQTRTKPQTYRRATTSTDLARR